MFETSVIKTIDGQIIYNLVKWEVFTEESISCTCTHQILRGLTNVLTMTSMIDILPYSWLFLVGEIFFVNFITSSQ